MLVKVPRAQGLIIQGFFPAEANIVVSECKLHNDATCDISDDGQQLAVFVPSHRGFPDDFILGVFSLAPDTLGDCLYTKSFGEFLNN